MINNNRDKPNDYLGQTHTNPDTQFVMKHNHTIPLAPIKLNTKKLPEDFFSRAPKVSCLPPKCPKLPKFRENPERNSHFEKRQIENLETELPEAQVTSFFNMAGNSNSTAEASQNNEQKQCCKTGRESSDHQLTSKALLSQRDITYSIQLNTSDQNQNDFLLTFAKKLEIQSNSKFKTPKTRSTARQPNLSNNKGQSTEILNIKKEGRTSVRISTKKRRNSHEMKQVEECREAKSSCKASSRRQRFNYLVLPKIRNC